MISFQNIYIIFHVFLQVIDDDGHFIALININFSLTVTQPSGEASRVDYLNSMSLVGYTPHLKIWSMSWVMKHVSHISLVFGSPSKQVWTSVLQCNLAPTSATALQNEAVTCSLQQERRQAADPEWLALSPGPRTHPATLLRHGGGQASLLQTVWCFCVWVSFILFFAGCLTVE